MPRWGYLLGVAIILSGTGLARAQEAHGSFFHSTPASPPNVTPTSPGATAPIPPVSPPTTEPLAVPPSSSNAPATTETRPSEATPPTPSDQAPSTGSASPQAGTTADRCGSTPAAVLAFARQYYEQGANNDIEAVLDYEATLYADQVEYYGKVFTRENVLKDKVAYLKRWPMRSYRLDSDPDIHCNQATSFYDFTGKVAWSARNPAKPETPVKSGVSLAQLGIAARTPAGPMKIVRESGHVIERYPDAPQ